MDRQSLLNHLALAQEHVARSEMTLARQRRVLAKLERDGHDTTIATKLLVTFEKMFAQQIADRDRLAREADNMSPDPAA